MEGGVTNNQEMSDAMDRKVLAMLKSARARLEREVGGARAD